MSSACSIHLGNYIIVVEQGAQSNSPPKQEKEQSPSRPQTGVSRAGDSSSNQSVLGTGTSMMNLPTQGSTTAGSGTSTLEMNSNGKGALLFELQWLKFLRDAEEEYITRLTRNDKFQQLSVFEVNVDIFESYLMRVSGRALSATQHLNLNLTSAMLSHMKIFDTQQEHTPYEDILRQEAHERMTERKERRMRRRLRNRRGTATFGAHEPSQTPMIQIEPKPVVLSSMSVGAPQHTRDQLFVLHPITEEQHSQIQLSENDVSQSPDERSLAGSQHSPPPGGLKARSRVADSFNERENIEGEVFQNDDEDREEILEAEEEEDEFDRAPIGAPTIVARPPPEEEDIFGNSREFEGTATLKEVQRYQAAFQDERHEEHKTEEPFEVPIETSSPQKASAQIVVEPNSQPVTEQSVDVHQQSSNNQVAASNNFTKIKIGEHTIGEPYQSLGDGSNPLLFQGGVTLGQNNMGGGANQTFELGEHYTINDVTELDNTNPFREKSVISYIPGGTGAGNSHSPQKEEEGSQGPLSSNNNHQQLNDQSHASIKTPQPADNQQHIKEQQVHEEYGKNTFEIKVGILNTDKLTAQELNLHEEFVVSPHQEEEEQPFIVSPHQEENFIVSPPQEETDHIQEPVQQQVLNKTQESQKQQKEPIIPIQSQQSLPSESLPHHEHVVQQVHDQSAKQTPEKHHDEVKSQPVQQKQEPKDVQLPPIHQERNIEVPLRQDNRGFAVALPHHVHTEGPSISNNTPLNMTLEEPEIPKVEASLINISQDLGPQKAEVALGTSDLSILKKDLANIATSPQHTSNIDEGLSAKTNSVAAIPKQQNDQVHDQSLVNVSKDMISATVSAQNTSLINTQGYQPGIEGPGINHGAPPHSQAPQIPQTAQQPHKLQITLTAEPDKPIMVEVSGGEKEYLIQSLTKHLFDILSRPKGLALLEGQAATADSGDMRESETDINSPEQLGQIDSKGVFTLNNNNINKKIRSLKKTLQNGELPQIQRNHQQPMFDTQARQEMYEGTSLPNVTNIAKGHLNIEEHEGSQHNQSLPGISQNHLNIENAHNNSAAFMQVNTNNWKSKGSSRSSASNIALSPLTTSNMDDPSNQRQQFKQDVQHAQLMDTHTDRHRNVIPTKRTANVEVERNINEEVPHNTQIESEHQKSDYGSIPNTNTPNTIRAKADSPSRGNIAPPPQAQHASQVVKQRGALQSNVQQSQESFRKLQPTDDLILQTQKTNQTNSSLSIPRSDAGTPTAAQGGVVHRSRPETANFNKAYAAAATQPNAAATVQDQEKQIQQMEEDLEHAKQRLSMMIRHENDEHQFFGAASHEQSPIKNEDASVVALKVPPETPNLKEDDISIDDQAILRSRLETPGADAQDGIRLEEIVNSEPAQLEQFNLPPLQPTIPQQHINGYFATESDYMMMRPDSQKQLVRQSNSSENNNKYMSPKLQYFEAQQQQQQVNSPGGANNDPFYQSYNSNFSEQDQNIPESDFILAEGYPIMNYGMDQNNGVMGQPQIYDFSQTAYNQVLGQSISGSSPNNYRIRKVILPNYQPMNNSTTFDGSTSVGHQSHHNMRTVAHNRNSPQLNSTGMGGPALYPPSHQSRFGSNHKQLPVVKTKKRYYYTTMQNIYGLNGGPAHKVHASYPQTRSLSPLRAGKNKVYYTTNYMTQKQLFQQHQHYLAQQAALLSPQQQRQIDPNALSVEDFQHFAYYSSSPQPNRMKHSPYMSDAEYKILHDFYDIQCEPTGAQRGGVPLMRVKRINRPKNKNFNLFNFPGGDDPQNVTLPKALSSLQIFYPQFQPSQNEMLSRTLASPSKWFERFNQSTRNLNNTIQNMHQQHNLGGGANGDGGLRQRSGSQQTLFVKRQTPVNAAPGMVEGNEFEQTPQREQNSLPQDVIMANISHDLGQSKGNSGKKHQYSTKEGNQTTFMPPLKKNYTQNMNSETLNPKDKQASKSTGGATKKVVNKLPPRPLNNKKTNAESNGPQSPPQQPGKAPTVGSAAPPKGGSTKNPDGKKTFSKTTSGMITPQTMVPVALPNSIINTNHNQYVCFGVNIITKSDK